MALHLRPTLAAVIATVVLVGCSVCGHEDDVTAPAPGRAITSKLSARAALVRHSRPGPVPKQEGKQIATQGAGTLKPQFNLLQGVEMVGRSRSYTGEEVALEICTEQCRATQGCDAFSFNKETKICYLVRQITGSSPNPLFVSGRPKEPLNSRIGARRQ
jgi:PAN domain-containing protein